MKRFATMLALLVALLATSVAVAASAGLHGTFTTTITGKGPNTLNGALDGHWKLVLRKGKYNVSDNGKSLAKGNYTIKKSTITLNDTSGSGKCKGTGKYKFKLKNKTLTVTKISDAKACIGRQDVLAHKLTKVA